MIGLGQNITKSRQLAPLTDLKLGSDTDVFASYFGYDSLRGHSQWTVADDGKLRKTGPNQFRSHKVNYDVTNNFRFTGSEYEIVDGVSPFTGSADIIPRYGKAPDGTGFRTTYFDVGGVSYGIRGTGTFLTSVASVTTTLSLWIKVHDYGTSGSPRIWFNGDSGAWTDATPDGSVTNTAPVPLNTWTRIHGTYSAGNNWLDIEATANAKFEIYGIMNFIGAHVSHPLVTNDPSFTSRAGDGRYTDSSGVIQTASTNIERTNHHVWDEETQAFVDSGQLLESSATNQLDYSHQFDDATWTKSDISVAVNQINAPNGNLEADLLTCDAVSATHFIASGNGKTVTSGLDYTQSIFVKKGTARWIQITFSNTSFGGSYANFDLDNLTIGNTSGIINSGIEKYGDDWCRIWISATCTATNTTNNTFLAVLNTDTASRVPSWDATSNQLSVYVHGAQQEEGNYPTSPITTSGSSVARAADVYTTTSKTTSYDKSGILIEEEKVNALADSNRPTTTVWDLQDAYIIPNNAVSPEGIMNATKLIAQSNSSNTHRIGTDTISRTSGQEYTFSFFAKAAEYNNVTIRLTEDVTFRNISFDLTSGTLDWGSTFIDSTQIIPLADGWYRFSITYTASGTGANRIFIYPRNVPTTSDTAPTFSGNDSSGIYFYGVQHELGQLSSYIETVPGFTSSAGTRYVTDSTGTLVAKGTNLSRFEHHVWNPATSAYDNVGLLLEETSTNFIKDSENFSTAEWVAFLASISTNTAVAPDGNSTADSLIEDTNNGLHLVRDIISATIDQVYTLSVFVKPVNRDFINIGFGNNASPGNDNVTFELSTGNKVEQSNVLRSSIESFNNGWYRVSVTAKASLTNFLDCNIITNNALSTTASYTGNGLTACYIFGAVCEEGYYPTSYIFSTGASTARPADVYSTTNNQELHPTAQADITDTTYWLAHNATITGGQSDPFGGTDAVIVEEDTINSSHGLAQNLSGRITWVNGENYVVSFFAKAREREKIRLTIDKDVLGTSTGSYVVFDLVGGIIDVENSITTQLHFYGIEDYGDGWYRCYLNFTSVTSLQEYFYPRFINESGDASYAGTTGYGMYFFGFSVYRGDALLDYKYSTRDACEIYKQANVNLLPNSSTFNVDWNQENAYSVLDGLNNPIDNRTYRITEDNQNTFHFISYSNASLSAGNYTYSVFMKEGTRRYGYVYLRANTGAERYAYIVDLQNGTIVDTYSTGTPTGVVTSVESYGDGWYRCHLSIDHSSGNVIVVCGLSDDDTISGGINNTYQGDGSYIYACHAQLTDDGIKPFMPSKHVFTSRAGVAYETDETGTLVQKATNEERNNHHVYINGSWVKVGQLLEETSTNLSTRSADLTQGNSATNNVSTALVTESNPIEGQTQVTRVTDDATNDTHYVQESTITPTANTWYTATYIVKAGTATSCRVIIVGGGVTIPSIYVDLTDGSNLNSSGRVKVVPLNGGWYQITVSAETTGTTALASRVYVTDGASATYSGSGDYIYVATRMLEQSFYETSYIATSGSATARAADVYDNVKGSDLGFWFDTPFTVFADFMYPYLGATKTVFSLQDEESSDRIHLQLEEANGQRWFKRPGTTGDDALNGITNLSGFARTASKHDGNNLRVGMNGVIAQNTNDAVISTNKICIGSRGGTGYLNGILTRLTIINDYVVDTEIKRLTIQP